MVDLEALKRSFRELFNTEPRLFSAPGRVNLIGEHTDYNDGFVLPIAVNRRTVVAAAANGGTRLRVKSVEFDEYVEIDLSSSATTSQPHWVTYVEGVARVLREREVPVSGADLMVTSTVPIGSGMSSSAALEMSVGAAIVALAGVEIDLIQLALAAQRAEHIYAGTKCGLMDQLAVAFGKAGHALLIDCRSFERKPIELKIANTAIVVCDTNVKHELATSAYNQRRAECEKGVELLREYLPQIRALRDVSEQDFAAYGERLPEPIRRRCRHVITENDRTVRASDALQRGNVRVFGTLMQMSHRSLRDDYEVSCRELDTMVDIARDQNGVAGARMTGGGFGGCTVNFVERSELDSFLAIVPNEYEQRTGRQATIYVVEAEDGVREVRSRST
ncbi:MAG TPA: galactokinase [Pyrinomonadaceae bacterium]|nr:galactokinase [Pyrinomonadaceae bacterium]